MTTGWTGWRDQIDAACARLNESELRVLALIATRLAKGREQYGALDLESDPRNWRREALEEAADGLVYVACALAKGTGRTV